MYRHLLVPTDGSPLSHEAVIHGLGLAREVGARITFLTVSEPFHTFSLRATQLEETPQSYSQHAHEHAQAILAHVNELARSSGVPHESIHIEDDEPYRAIIHTAVAKGCDLIVMASHGRRGVSALVLGSETMKVLTYSSIPVLVYRLAPAQLPVRKPLFQLTGFEARA